MKASFAKLDHGDWGVRVEHDHATAPDVQEGTELTITKRNGQTKQVKVGAKLNSWNGGSTRVYALGRNSGRFEPASNPALDALRRNVSGKVASGEAEPIRAITVSEPGVYETPHGVIYVVKPNREKTRLYAKRLVEINAERATEAGERVEIEFEYEAGAIYLLEPGMKMSLEKAKQLTIRYGRCIVCGRKLKAAESVERGIGPVCIKSFRNYEEAVEAI